MCEFNYYLFTFINYYVVVCYTHDTHRSCSDCRSPQEASSVSSSSNLVMLRSCWVVFITCYVLLYLWLAPIKNSTAYNRTDNLLRHRFKECGPTWQWRCSNTEKLGTRFWRTARDQPSDQQVKCWIFIG
jgi:hypothetical protein